LKLIVAVIQDRDANDLQRELTRAEFRVTKLASTGGFLRSGNTTMLIGTEEDRIERALELIHQTCKSREHLMPAHNPAGPGGDAYVPFATHVTVGGATVFVLDVAQFEKY
jgi:uncharacterized protein YaaQ